MLLKLRLTQFLLGPQILNYWACFVGFLRQVIVLEIFFLRQCSDLRQRASTEPFQSQLGTGEKWRTVLLELYTGTSFLGGCTLTGTSFADLGSSDDQISAGPRLKEARHFFTPCSPIDSLTCVSFWGF